MGKNSSLPYLYEKLLRTFSYSVEKWVEIEETQVKCTKRTTRSDFIVTREYHSKDKQLLTWAETNAIIVKLELRREAHKKVIVIKYGEKGTVTPKALRACVPNTAGVKKIKEAMRGLIEELLKQDFIR